MELGEVLSPVKDLGEFIREQRTTAQISLRGLAAKAGVSNPYLSQVERGLRRPSADILAQIARGLSISAESLLVRAGVLDDPAAHHTEPDPTETTEPPEGMGPGGSTTTPSPAAADAAHQRVLTAISGDPALSPRHRAALIEIYTGLRARPAPAPHTQAAAVRRGKEQDNVTTH